MSSLLRCAVLLISVFAASVRGQEKKAEAGRGDAVEVRFADGSVVKMTMLHERVDVATRYGRLSVPGAEIRRIEFGLRVPAEKAKAIDAAIARLAAPDAGQRDAAAAELLALRELAYPALRRAAASSDAELARRAADVLRALAEAVPAELLRLPAHDTVVTAEFTITGRVETSHLTARSPYFGEAKLNPAELRSVRWLGTAREVKASVDAARYGGAQDEWLDTGVDVRAGTTIQVTATGSVQLADGEGTRVGPDGLLRRRGEFAGAAGGPGGAGLPGAAGGFGGRAGRAGFSPATAGALLGRVGPAGRTFFLGSRYEGAAPEDGRLYVRIGPSPGSAGEPAGSYDVRVSVGR